MVIDIKSSVFDPIENIISTAFVEEKIEKKRTEYSLSVELMPSNGKWESIGLSIKNEYPTAQRISIPIFMLDRLIAHLEEIKTASIRKKEDECIGGGSNATV